MADLAGRSDALHTPGKRCSDPPAPAPFPTPEIHGTGSDSITRLPDPSAAAATPSRRASVGRLLDDLGAGRQDALAELFPLVYDELRELAHRQRTAWQGDETLNTTALVHEAFLKLVDRRRATWDSEAHFLATAAKAIRHVRINYARDRQAQKRGGGWQRVSLRADAADGAAEPAVVPWEDRVLALHDALRRLEERSARQHRIVECRFFGGMTVGQTARALHLSTATVTRGWAMARAWLHRDLAGPGAVELPP